MVSIEEYGKYETSWCPGCGNFSLVESVKRALVELGLKPHQVLMVSGIGQAAKTPHYLNANVFNGLHGRAIPAATGAKLANSKLVVIAESGDGCMYGEGAGHFIAAIRRNIDITLIVHDNQVYGLTKGQASPTAEEGFVTKAQPGGVIEGQFNPIEIAVALRAGFVARSFTGMSEQLSDLIVQGINHRGLALIDVFQPCVTFNKVNTFAWYKKRCMPLPANYDPTNWDEAMRTAAIWGEQIPVGVIYKGSRPSFDDRIDVLKSGPLVGAPVSRDALKSVMEAYR